MKLRLGHQGHTYKLYKNAKNKVLNVSASLVLVAMSLGGALPAFITSTAHAAGVPTTVTPTSHGNWSDAESQTGGNVSFVNDSSAPSGSALKLTTDSTAYAKAHYQNYFTTPVALSSIGSDLSYSTKQNSAAFTAGDPAYQITVNVFGNSGYNNFTYEPYVDQGNAAVTNGTWQSWDVGAGKFYSSHSYSSAQTADGTIFTADQGTHTYTLAQIRAAFPNAMVTGVGVNVGSNNPSYDVEADNVEFNGLIYDFNTNPIPTEVYVDSSYTNANSGTHTFGYDAFTNIPQAVDAVAANGTVNITSNLTVSQQVTITKTITLNGNGHTFSPNFFKTDNDNNSALSIQANNVIVNNLVEDGTLGTNLHGINIFDVTGVNLNDVTTENNNRIGVNVNSSTVTVNNITTAHNGWHGIDVDKTGAVLTVNGTSHHTETTPDIYIDNTAVGQVVDTNNQYGYVNNKLQAGDRVYKLKLATPELNLPANNGYETTNDFWFDWHDVTGAVSYEFQTSQNPSTTNGVLNNGVWSGDYQHNQPTASTLRSVGASGTWYWQVRAVDANGIKSDWSSPWKMTIDTTTPAIPTNLSWLDSSNNPAVNGFTTVQKGTLSWHDTSNGDADHYIYKFWTNIPGYFDGASNAWTTEGSQYITKSTTGGSIWTDFANKEGTYYFCVAAVDAAGNASACSTTYSVTYDATNPSDIQNLTPTNLSYITTHNFSFDWTSSTDANAVTYNWESSLTSAPKPDGSFMSPLASQKNLTASEVASPGTPDATYYWHVQAVDAAGNVSAWTPTWKVTVDTQAPQVAITAPSDGNYVHGTVTVKGTVSDTNPDHYYFVVKDSHGAVKAGPGTVNQATVADWNWNTKAVDDGVYTIDLEARDAAGNKDASSTKTIQVTVDNSAPDVHINGYGQSGNVIQPNVTATDANAMTFAWTPVTSGVTISDTTAKNPTFTVTTDGTYTFNLTVTDAAGNSTTKSFSFTYTTPVTPTTTPTAAPTSPTTPAFTAVATTPTNTSTGTTPLTDSGTGTTQPQVKGDSTTGNVKGDNTVKVENSAAKKTSSSNFLGLGWWWIPFILVLLGFFWFVLARRRHSDNA